jgi:apolipoprotein N-acyltransferase
VPGDAALTTFATARPRLANLAFFACGAALMLSFAPVGAYLLAPILLLPLLFSALRCVPRQAAWHGFCFGAGLFLAGTYWLYVSIHVFGEAPLFVAIFLMIALVIIMGFYYAACTWLICTMTAGSFVRFLAIAPATWVTVEWIRGWFLSGFPWMSLGYGQIDSTLAGFAPVTGVYGVSFLLVLSAAGLAVAILEKSAVRYLFLTIAATPWLAGAALQTVSWGADAGPPVRTTIVQGGISQDRKWLPEQFNATLNLYRDSIANHTASKLVVWPEVAIPAALDQIQPYVAALQADIASQQQTLLFGILERDAAAAGIFNSVVALDGSTIQVYRKRHLVPFGEYFPVPGFVREWMRLMSLPHSDISAGDPRQTLISMPDGNQLAIAICYEDAYGAEQLYALPGASILINVSNDGWFGDTIAPHQHLEIARMRALEVARFVVRATNNGVSAFIGPRGELLDTGAQFIHVAMTRDVVPRSGLTPYAAGGNWPVVVVCLALIAGFGYPGWRRMPGNQ